MKKSTGFLLIFFILLLVFYFNNQSTKNIDKSISGTDSVSTNGNSNLKLDYYYYIPIKVANSNIHSAPFLIMVPGLNGSGQSFVSEQFKDFAKKEGFVIIAPTFTGDDADLQRMASYQYPAVWSGAALNKIIKTFSVNKNISPSAIYLFGFSAGAQFVSRYALLYPNYTTACALIAPWSTDDPKEYLATKFFVAIGANDEEQRQETAVRFYNLAKNQNINVSYNRYNVAHELTEAQINDSIIFFTNVKHGS